MSHKSRARTITLLATRKLFTENFYRQFFLFFKKKLCKMDLRSWVSDNVMKILGMSEKIFVDFIIAEAQSCETRESLREKLDELPQTTEAQRFINDLFDRVPRKKPQKDEAYLKRKREEQE